MNKAVFFDRDGVLLQSFPESGKGDAGPRTFDQATILPWVHEACDILRDAGFRLLVVTNQPEIKRGLTTLPIQQQINRMICSTLRLNEVYMCDHDAADRCCCRKPRPGLIFAAAYVHCACLADSFLIGDRDKDIQAADAAGVNGVLIPPNSARLLTVAREIVSS